ncbi:hypothetical protein BKK49_05060 [Rodentibacter rarus]|uniref:Lipoprotein n=1 Tax=Rodentibacter rarus TaxID=1908260 RepID=A0A1V3IRQ5_9PAST|nr:hypothetical protein [Rodentibacter rarus]OOF41314.1 hypothetical protein BKK49_05060 [Rodentibacter rarus]OOF44589.1 hypothetical protein BKK50_01945 [Rodentibacter rarus]
MKKLFIALPALFLMACSTQQTIPQDSGIYDMKTVQEYRAQVASGRTVSAAQKARVANEMEEPIKMNASDSVQKVKYQRAPVAIVPSVGVGYYRGYHHHHW